MFFFRQLFLLAKKQKGVSKCILPNDATENISKKNGGKYNATSQTNECREIYFLAKLFFAKYERKIIK